MGIGASTEHDEGTIVHDDRFGGQVGLVNRRNKVYIVKTITVSSEDELNRMVSLSMDRARLKHKNFCTVRNYEIDKNRDMCSNNKVVRLYFDFLDNDLERDIMRRSEKQEFYREQAICSLLLNLTECLRYLEENSCYQGDIKSSNIFLDQNGNPKLIDSYFTHFGRSNFEIVLSNPTVMAYLSPEQLSSLRKGHYTSPKENRVKNQVFSLAMTIMEAMLLQNSFDCYEMNLLRVVDLKIQQKRAIMLKRYSQPLVDLVVSMLQNDENRRPSFTEIINSPVLKPYSSKISLSGLHHGGNEGSRLSANGVGLIPGSKTV